MGNISYSAADINTINQAADDALSTMNTKIAALEAIVANTGLRGTAGEQLQKQLDEAKSKMETAKEKIAAVKTTAEDKVASEAAKNAKVEEIANR